MSKSIALVTTQIWLSNTSGSMSARLYPPCNPFQVRWLHKPTEVRKWSWRDWKHGRAGSRFNAGITPEMLTLIVDIAVLLEFAHGFTKSPKLLWLIGLTFHQWGSSTYWWRLPGTSHSRTIVHSRRVTRRLRPRATNDVLSEQYLRTDDRSFINAHPLELCVGVGRSVKHSNHRECIH